MQITKVKNRGVLFTQPTPDWNLNLYLITGDKYNYIIDTGLGSFNVDEIKEHIKNDNKEIIVINTHHHWDHVWGNGSLKDCMIVSHRLCRDIIRSEWEEDLQKNARYCCGAVEMCLPNLVFDRELYFAEDGILLFHTPGHTPDSISIIDETDKVLILGDNVGDNMEELIPSIDCDRAVYLNTLKKYERMEFDICISGHNEILKRDTINTIINMI